MLHIKKIYLSLLIILIIPFSVNAAITDGAQAHYSLSDFNDTIGNFDLSATGSPTLVTSGCKIGNCYSFSGTAQNFYANITNLTYGNASYTISLWTNRTARTGYHEIAFLGRAGCTGGAGNAGCNVGFGHYNSNNLWYWGYYSEVDTTTAMNNNVWYHIAQTYDAPTARTIIYLNNAVVYNVTNRPVRMNSTMLFLGGITGSNYYNGIIDEVTVFNTSKTKDEIDSIYRNESLGIAYPWTPTAYYNYSLKVQTNAGTTGVLSTVVIIDNTTNTCMVNTTNSTGGFIHYFGYNAITPLTPTSYVVVVYQNTNTSRQPLANWSIFNSYN